MAHRFVGFPAAVLYDAPDGNAAMQRIWGSFLSLTGQRDGDWLQVRFGRDQLWVKEADTQERGTLELLFLDIGQGDSCILTTPDNRKLIIDAGANDNLVRFLKWKFRFAAKPVRFEAFVITHPDEDHYHGFDPVLDDVEYEVGTVYHSGLVERAGTSSVDSLGTRVTAGTRTYVTGLVDTNAQLDQLLTPARIGRKQYPAMLRKSLDSGRVGDIRKLDATDGFVPGFGAADDVSIRVLGPVREDAGGASGLRWLSSVGKTKNGHSVVLRLVYGGVSFLLGGDLNIPAEEYLLEHYTGLPVPPRTVQDEELLVRRARTMFESDFAKSCHHGSADFTEFFLKAVNANATVISSGDDEPHAHPRADTLGTVGKHSRGRRSLIFSTELARSTRETITNAPAFRQQIRDAVVALEAARVTNVRVAEAEAALEALLELIERSVSVFGAINMRTDGDRAIFAYRIERPRGPSAQWDIYTFERDATGELVFDSKH